MAQSVLRFYKMRPNTPRALAIALLCGAAWAACTLSPQPLPPGEFASTPGTRADAGGFGGGSSGGAADATDAATPSDAGALDVEDAADAGDAAATDAGDASIQDASRD
jgi:hypothetical protein